MNRIKEMTTIKIMMMTITEIETEIRMKKINMIQKLKDFLILLRGLSFNQGYLFFHQYLKMLAELNIKRILTRRMEIDKYWIMK
jgi:hypothetical protein